MARGMMLGHIMVFDPAGPCWRWEDTRQDIGLDTEKRSCVLCGERPTPDGHDPCIANLPGVHYACCGHGLRDGYVSAEGEDARPMCALRCREAYLRGDVCPEGPIGHEWVDVELENSDIGIQECSWCGAERSRLCDPDFDFTIGYRGQPWPST